MGGTVTVVNDTVLSTWKLPRVLVLNVKYSPYNLKSGNCVG